MTVKNVQGKWYELVDQAEEKGLVSNGKWIEGTFKNGETFYNDEFLGGFIDFEDVLAFGAQPARQVAECIIAAQKGEQVGPVGELVKAVQAFDKHEWPFHMSEEDCLLVASILIKYETKPIDNQE